MLNDIILIGDKIDIRPLDHEGKPMYGTRPYASMLVNIEDEETIHITAPIIQNKLVLLHTGREYHLTFYTETGLFQCKCTSISHYKDNKTVVLKIKLTSKIVKLQRRQYYRLECIHDIKYRFLTEDDDGVPKNNDKIEQNNEKVEHNWIKGAIIDISGGGARLNSAIRHQMGDKIRIKLELVIGSKLRVMELDAEVLASGRVENRSDLYEHRVQFSNISKKDREDLIRYIFEQDRLRRKNEKADL